MSTEQTKAMEQQSISQDAQVLLTVQDQLHNIAKSLQCPVCLSTFRDPVMAVCLHAFCRECIMASLKDKQQCPVCKFKCTKRGLVSSDHLADIVKGFKLTMRAFGFAPVVYSEGMAMTQLVDDELSFPDVDVDGDKQKDNQSQIKGPSLLRCHEHLEVSRAVHNVLKSATVTMKPAEEVSRIPNARSQQQIRLQNLLRDQEKIIEVDQQALIRAAVTKSRKNAVASSPGETVVYSDAGSDGKDFDAVSAQGVEEKETAAMIPGLGKKNDNELEFFDQSHEAERNEETSSNESRGREARLGSISTDPSSAISFTPMGNKPQEISTQDLYDASMEENREKELADRSAEMLLEFERNSNVPEHNHSQETSPLDETISRSSSETGDIEFGEATEWASEEIQPKIAAFFIGSLVHVQARSWPGVNKQGGIGRITKVHESSDSVTIKYDVSYVLGGKERLVDGMYISAVNDEPDQPSPRMKQCSQADPKQEKENLTLVQGKGRKKRSFTPSHETSVIRSPDLKIAKPSEEDNQLHEPTTQQILDLAIEVYKRRFRDEVEKCLLKGRMNIVTSGLCEYESSLINVFVAEMKEKNLKIKLSKDFNPQNTSFCVSSYDRMSNTGAEIENVATHRTMKLMRATLAGVPIMTIDWVSACIEKKELLEPSCNHIIHTLPTKTDRFANGSPRYGVVRSASNFGQSNKAKKLLDEFSVLLCGQFKSPGSPKLADIHILLNDSGASIVPSASECIKRIKASTIRSSQNIREHCFVLICDDSSIDSSCGISSDLEGTFELAMDTSHLSFVVATTQWLFDCIACGSTLNCHEYEPNSPRGKALWLKAKHYDQRINA